jgi:hypothetical protein
MNQIIVTLPNPDATTGKLKKAEHLYLQINRNLEMKVARSISFWEEDGKTPAIADPKSKIASLQFQPIEVTGTTENDWVDPKTGWRLDPVYGDDGEGNRVIINGAIPELLFWQSLPLSKALTGLPKNILDALDQAGVKVSDVVYGLIEASILNDHQQGYF